MKTSVQRPHCNCSSEANLFPIGFLLWRFRKKRGDTNYTHIEAERRRSVNIDENVYFHSVHFGARIAVEQTRALE